jgi:hypothetical protein
MNSIASLRSVLGAIVLAPFLSTGAIAFIRAPMWDDVLVDQSDLIVIAHLKENQFEMANDPENPQPDRKMFYTTLVVSKVLKGSAPLGDLRVGLHDPNYPTVLGGPLAIVPSPAGEHPDASAAIGIAAIVGTIFATSTDDVRQDHLWFLRTHATTDYHYPNSAGSPGLWFPEGVQPLKLEPYYQAIFAGDADAVGAFADADPKSWWSHRVHFCQAALEVKNAATIPDLNARCDELLAIYVREGPFTPAGELALKDVMDCGPSGEAKLASTFLDSQNHDLDRRSILTAWQQTNYAGATPAIIKWLRDEDAWWNTKMIADKIWACHEGQRGGDDPRGTSFRNIYCSVENLAGSQNAEAQLLVIQIREHWKAAAPFDSNNDFLKVCDDAIARLK